MVDDFYDNEEREQYQGDLMGEVEQQAKNYDKKDADEIFDVMIERFNIRHTESGKTDGFVNWTKAEKEWKKNQYNFSKSEESFLRYQADADGISLSQAKRNARKLLKKGGAK